MPRLLYSSEIVGCGATLKLDSQETCMVSIAQSGVLVKSSNGRFGWFLISFFGSVLYNEKNVYKAAATAAALDTLFPERHIPVRFRNPALNSFSNAIWQCSTAAEVAVTLNNALTRVEQTKSDAEIVDDLAALMARGETGAGAFYDVSLLPHPKEAVLLAIEQEILREPSEARVEWLKVGATFLPFFQEGIGPDPLFWTGIDHAELGRTFSNLQDETKNLAKNPNSERAKRFVAFMREQAKTIAQNPDRDRTERLLALMKTETDQITARIEAAVRLRNARIR